MLTLPACPAAAFEAALSRIGPVTRFLSPVAVVFAGLLVLPSPAGAPPGPSVDVVKVQGAIDPSLAAYVRGTLRAAEAEGADYIGFGPLFASFCASG